MTTDDTPTRPDEIPADVWPILDGFTRRIAAVHYPYTLPAVAVPVRTLADVRAALHASGSHYFDRETVRAFAARSHGNPTGRGFFVESIRDTFRDDNPRQYRVSWLSRHADGLASVEHSHMFDTLDAARAARDVLARNYPREA